MNQALEKMKMLVGMDVEDEEAAPQQESFMDDFNRNCTLSTKQVWNLGDLILFFDHLSCLSLKNTINTSLIFGWDGLTYSYDLMLIGRVSIYVFIWLYFWAKIHLISFIAVLREWGKTWAWAIDTKYGSFVIAKNSRNIWMCTSTYLMN